MIEQYFATLMRHHAWAVRRILDTATLVSPSELNEDILSHGSLLATMQHVADVDQSWGRVAQGLPEYEPETLAGMCSDLATLREFWLSETLGLIDFAESLSQADLEREMQPSWRKQPRKIWQILLHISNHRAEHGNQIGWHLTTLGHSPGEMGFMGFMGFIDLQQGR